jgi:hypothetical protein
MSLLLLLLASIVTLVTTAILAVMGRRRRARRVLVRWGIGVAAYAGILLATAMRPHEVAFQTGAPFCDDDMCGSLESITKTPAASGEVTYRLGFRLFSRANRGSRSTKGAAFYLSDDRNRRFLPFQESSGTPFDVPVQPGQSVNTSLSFKVPSDARSLFFNAGVNSLQYASFVIGNGDLLRKPRIRFRIE